MRNLQDWSDVKSPRFSKGVRYILVSTFFFALMNTGVKYLERVPAHEIVLFRALVTLVVGYILIRRAGLHPWGNNKPVLILRGLAGTAALVMYFYTLQVMPLATAVTVQYLSPIFTIIIAGVMLRESTRPIQWLFFVISFGGVVLIRGFDARVSTPDLLVGIAAAVFSGLAYNFIRKLRGQDHPLVVVFYFPMVTVPLVGSYTVTHWVGPTAVEWVVLILIGLATTVAQIYMTMAYQSERASNVSIFNYLGTVYAIIIGLVLFDETVQYLALLGIGLILFGVIMSSRYRQAPG